MRKDKNRHKGRLGSFCEGAVTHILVRLLPFHLTRTFSELGLPQRVSECLLPTLGSHSLKVNPEPREDASATPMPSSPLARSLALSSLLPSESCSAVI